MSYHYKFAILNIVVVHPTEVQHGIPRRVFANTAHAHCVCGLSVEQHGNPTVAGWHGRAQERRPLCPVLANGAYRWATWLPTGSGQAAAQSVVRRRDSVRPAGRLLVPDIIPRVHTEVILLYDDWWLWCTILWVHWLHWQGSLI